MSEYNNARLWQIGFFSLNNAATNIYMAVMAYISYYANNIAGFAAMLITMVLSAMNVFDGITDPIAGYILDKTKGRLGKFRPFMLFGNIMMAGSSFLLFFTTHYVPNRIRLFYFIIIYVVYVIGFTLQTVVGKSGQTILTDNPEQRPISTYFDSMFIMASYGGIALYVADYLVPKYGDFSNSMLYQELIIVVIIISFLCTLFAITGIWEKDCEKYYAQGTRKETVKIKDYFTIMKHNKPMRMLILSACMNRFASTVYSHTAVLVMLFGIMMKDYSIAGVIGVVTAVPTLLIVTLGIRVAQRFGQKRSLVLFTWVGIGLQIVMTVVLLHKNVDTIRFSFSHLNGITIAFFCVFVLLNGCKSITNNMVVPMIADCSDYEVIRSGKYVPGLMGALFSFVDKSFTALGTAFVGIVLLIIGYGKNLPQITDTATPAVRSATIFMYCIIPIIGWLTTVVAMRYYSLDKRKMKEIQRKKWKNVLVNAHSKVKER